MKPISMNELVAELSRFLTRSAPEATLPEQSSLPHLCWQSVSNPALLRKRLEEDALPIFDSLNKGLVIGDVKRFASLLERYGRHHEAAALIHFARTLMGYVELVDVRGIQRTLEMLPIVLGLDRNKQEGDGIE